jgi:tricorn protease
VVAGQQECAFISQRGDDPDLYFVPATGGEPTRLTSLQGAESSPAWSPDGKTIAFSAEFEATSSDIWTVLAAGGTPPGDPPG